MTPSSDSSDEAARHPVPQGGEEDMQDAYRNALPEGITTRLVREYMVGPYRYTELAQAIAERDRQKLLAET